MKVLFYPVFTYIYLGSFFQVALSSFGTYVLSSPTNILDANKAFVSLSLFNIMSMPMSLLPAVIAFGVQAVVSIGRIGRFLNKDELDESAVQRDKLASKGKTSSARQSKNNE